MKKFALNLVIPIILVAVWQLAVSEDWWPRTLIASPREVGASLLDLLRSGELLAHARVSLIRLMSGFALGAGVALVLGSAVGLSTIAQRVFDPTIQALTPIPPPAWIPLLIIFFGIGETSKVGLIAIGAFGVVYLNAVQGIRSTDQRLVEVAQVLSKRRWELITRVLLPSATPTVLTGMRVALALSWILLIASELISARMASEVVRAQGLGLGWLIFDARRFSRPDEMIVGMISMGVLGKLTDMAMLRIQNRLLVWRESFAGV
ncbi:MAG TPA: ABC transporter permease [Thermoanaerobaculia bacterium]|jgi:sulfonate transport system permease protein